MTSLILPNPVLSTSCSSEVLSSSEHAAQLQRSEILEECEQGRNCCYTLQSVEKVMKKVRTSNRCASPKWTLLAENESKSSGLCNHINCLTKLFFRFQISDLFTLDHPRWYGAQNMKHNRNTMANDQNRSPT